MTIARALSVIELQGSGWVYIVGAQHSGMAKIGYASNVRHRLSVIQTDNHLPLVLCYLKRGTTEDEDALMKRFRALRVRGSWFNVAPDNALGRFLEPFVSDIEMRTNIAREWRLS